MVACWTILKLSQVAPTAHTNTPLRLAMLEAAGSCQRHCSCLNSRMFWCTRDVDSAALVQLSRKYDKRKQESSGQLIDQDDNGDDDDAKGGGGDAHACGHVGPVQRPPAGQNFSKTLLQVYGPLSSPATGLHLLFLAAFQECCNAACSYRVRHCVRRWLAKNESVAIISGLLLLLLLLWLQLFAWHQSLLMLTPRSLQAPLKRIRNIATIIMPCISVNGFYHATVKPRFLITLAYQIGTAKRTGLKGCYM